MGFFKVLAALLVLAPGVGGADAVEPDRSCAEAVARKVQGHYEAIADWSASFEQTRQAVVFGGGLAAPEPTRRGTVVFAKPGRMRWSYVEPDPSLFVTDGTVVWTWDPLLEEAQRLPDAGGVLSGAAVRFLMGEGDLIDAFRITAADCAARPVRLELLPKRDEGYERLVLHVDPETGQVASSSVTDLFGNRTTVSFADVRTNTSPDPSVFTFEPPEGATVIDLAVPDEGGAAPRSGAGAGR
jgi:outer membrane lipoprotein carrier protein